MLTRLPGLPKLHARKNASVAKHSSETKCPALCFVQSSSPVARTKAKKPPAGFFVLACDRVIALHARKNASVAKHSSETKCPALCFVLSSSPVGKKFVLPYGSTPSVTSQATRQLPLPWGALLLPPKSKSVPRTLFCAEFKSCRPHQVLIA